MNLTQFAKLIWLNRQLMKSQWWPREQIEIAQDNLIGKLVQKSYAETAFYRDRMRKNGISPDEVRDRQSLTELAPTPKDEYLQAIDEDKLSVRSDRAGLMSVSTSGSTGSPCTIHFTPNEFIAAHRATYSRFYRLYGRSLLHSVAYIGPGRSLNAARRSLLSKLIPHRFYSIDSYSPLDDQVDFLIELNADLIMGYTDAIDRVASRIVDKQIESVRPNSVYTGASMLGPRTREVVRKAFGADLYDTFSCNEFGNIAWECPSRSGLYHGNDEMMLLEVVDRADNPVAPGQQGELLVTSLTNFTQPLIRYRLGDYVETADEPCNCGRSLTSFRSIEGRKTESLSLPDGRDISGNYFGRQLRLRSDIARFQVVQLDETNLLLKVVKLGETVDLSPDIEEFEKDLKVFKIQVEFVNEIRSGRNSKARVLIPLQSS